MLEVQSQYHRAKVKAEQSRTPSGSVRGESCHCLAQVLVTAASLGSWPLHLQCHCLAFSLRLPPLLLSCGLLCLKTLTIGLRAHLYNLAETPFLRSQFHHIYSIHAI